MGLLALSRARVGDGAGDFTLFVPPLVFFAVGIVLHLLFWLPGPVLGARLGARANPLNPRSSHGGVGSAL